MFLDPLNAVISPAFYRRVATQVWWRSLLYLAYLSLLLSLAFTAALKIHGGPRIDATFEWLKKSVPTMTFVNGKITSAMTAPLTLRHPDLQQIAVTIDTNRVEPVTLQALEEAKVQAFLSSNALYFEDRPGHLNVYNFSTAADPKPVTIDAAFFESARRIFERVLYPAVFAAGVLFNVLWLGGWTLIFALVGLLLNALAEGGAPFGALVSIALYAQTLSALLQGLTFLAGINIPKWTLVSLVLTGIYIWLAIAKLRQPPAGEAPTAA